MPFKSKAQNYDNYEMFNHYWTFIHLNQTGLMDESVMPSMEEFKSYHTALSVLAVEFTFEIGKGKIEGWYLIESRISLDLKTAEYYVYLPVSGICIEHRTVYPYEKAQNYTEKG